MPQGTLMMHEACEMLVFVVLATVYLLVTLILPPVKTV